MITVILIMVWSLCCALCAAAGYMAGRQHKKQPPVVPAEPSAEEKKRFAREMREMENFFAYDGSEQTEPPHLR